MKIEHTPTYTRFHIGRLMLQWNKPKEQEWPVMPPIPNCKSVGECMYDVLACADADRCLHPSWQEALSMKGLARE